MQILKGDNIVFFDVDNTLIIWDYPSEDAFKAVGIPTLCTQMRWDSDLQTEVESRDFVSVIPHHKHLTMIKRHKQLGNTVVVWSKSGAAWAENVVKFFELEQYVDLICGKPTCFYDDLKPEEFMVERRFFSNN